MKQEISAAARWIVNCIEGSGLSPNLLNQFETTIIKLLCEKFAGHWHTDDPRRGQGFRSILVERNLTDELIIAASVQSGISDIENRIRRGWTMWIDPGEVEVRDEVTRQNTVVYKTINSTTIISSIITNNNDNNIGRVSPLKISGNNNKVNNNNTNINTVNNKSVSPRAKSPPRMGRTSPPLRNSINNNYINTVNTPSNRSSPVHYNNYSTHYNMPVQQSDSFINYGEQYWNSNVAFLNNAWHLQGNENNYNFAASAAYYPPRHTFVNYDNENTSINNNTNNTTNSTSANTQQKNQLNSELVDNLEHYPRNISSRA